jgi:hypothetical protein
MKEVLLENYDHLIISPTEEEDLADFADRFVPLYGFEVVKDWLQLPDEQKDKWKELGYDANKNEGGILRLMQMDLIFYYLEETNSIWEELKKEKAK